MAEKHTQSLLKRLLPYMGNKKYLLPLALLLSAVSSVLGLLPFVFIWFISREFFTQAENMSLESVGYYAWMTLGTAFLAMLLYFFALICSHLAAFRCEVGMRKIAMRRIINMPLGFFDQHQSGKMRKIIDDNASQTHTFLAHQLPDLSASIIAPLVLLVLVLIIDWRMGIVSLIPIGLGFVSMSFMMTTSGKKFQKLYMDSLEDMSSEAVEYVRGIPVVKTFGQSVYAFKRFVGCITKYKDMVYTYTLMWRKPWSFYTVIMQSTAFFLVPFTIFLLGQTQNMAAVLIDFVFYLLIAPNFTLLLTRSMYFKNYSHIALQAIERFDAVLDYPEMLFEKNGAQPTSYSLTFKGVVFAYEGARTNAVDGISFTVQEGETVALVGPSGGGKTTIARLAARFWDLTSGEILIGGENITTISRKELMERVAFVFQNTRLFKKTLRENITYGKADASEEAIQRAIDLSQSRNIIDQLPDGLDTRIGKDGTYLSSGEQQRLALARAILKDAPIVLLDEATAFADPENEHLIQRALHELSRQKTTLMIAHRLTTVKDADRILVIDHGKIVQSGTHEDLLNEGGVYKRMWNEYQSSIKWKI
ncbi:ABC transporter ATP-binding protein [candidate division KSB3 bacterium]|uniref:ABC transporter ATP-binding protein n=1 Tax=candidate division KSB3 bacterium TaxID=2044937 RepID=A0A2G6E9B7_9BACT|nr:MAG: ABC transporter ATP-binding protein [candidate division KSB3 bacterium]PIE30665.1 MAG: ABC transporter ATP-binding protein [candidate division KSB3 bacterium]